MEKRAQEMTLGTIILIVLGIAVLVFLIFGFSTGWNNLWDKITSFGGKSNVDTIRQACALACSSKSKYDFCEQERTVKFGKKVEAWNGTGISEVASSKGTCLDFSKNEQLEVAGKGGKKPKYPGLNVASCSSISC